MFQFILALVVILTFGFFIFRKPSVETYVLFVTFALPFIDLKILPSAYGLIRVFDVITVFSLILFFKNFTSFKKKGRYITYVILVVLFWIFTLLGKLNSQFPTEKLFLLYQVFTIFIYTRFIFIYIEENPKNRDNLVYAFKVSYTIAVAWVFVQTIVGTNFTYYEKVSMNVYNESTGVIRYPGVFNDSQYNGQFLAMGSFIFLLFKKNISTKKKYFHYIGFAFAVLALILAGARSALGGFIVGLTLLLLIAKNRTKIIAAFIGCLGFIIFSVASPKVGILSRTASLSNDFLFRSSIWEETYTIIEKYPTLGIGFGNYQKYISNYHQDLYLEFEPGEFVYFHQPENGYLKILVEQGVFAFVIFLCFMVLPIITCLTAALLKDKKEMIFISASLLAWLVAFTTVYSLVDYRLLVSIGFFASLALLYDRSDINHSSNK